MGVRRNASVVQAELEEQRTELEQLSRTASELRATVVAGQRLISQECTEQLAAFHGAFQAGVREGAAVYAGWTDPSWHGETSPSVEELLAEVRVGRLLESGLGANEADLPYLAPLFGGSQALIILCDEASRRAARVTLQSILLRVACAMPGAVRFSLIDPLGLGAAFPFRGLLPRDRLRATGRSPGDELGDVLDEIRRVNEHVVGTAARFADLSAEQRAGESFEVVACTDFPKAYARDPRSLDAITKIASAGPRAGRHLILERNVAEKLPHDFSEEQLSGAFVIDCRSPGFALDELPSGEVQKRLLARAGSQPSARERGDWSSVVRPSKLFSGSSAALVETPIGERLRFWLGEERGKQSAHSVVAGQSGSGKSYWLHAVITGLAARYAPDELRFTFIDGKDGVEFRSYQQLPHADVVCLRTPPAMARSVLADFHASMKERYATFLALGVQKLEDYRAKSGLKLPRKILMIDEYQQVFEGDNERAAEQLMNELLAQGRAAGTHVVLCSQLFQTHGLSQNAMSQIQLRASLALAQDYAQSIQVFGAEGRRLIQGITGSGEVVMNDESGRDGANTRGAVARFAKEGPSQLQAVVQELVTASGQASRPIVLNGREACALEDNRALLSLRQGVPSAEQLQTLARRARREGGFGMESWLVAERPVPLWLGRRFDVSGHVLCALRRAPAQNLLIVGSQTEVRHRMLASALAALPLMLPADAWELFLVDGQPADLPGAGMLTVAASMVEARGVAVQRLTHATLETVLGETEELLRAATPLRKTRILVLAEPEYLYPLQASGDRFSLPKAGPPAQLRELLKKGSQLGVHVIMTAASLPSVATVLAPNRELSMFTHRVVQQLNEEDSLTLFSAQHGARLREQADHPFTSLYVDQLTGVRAAQLFHAYAAQRDLNADQGVAALTQSLGKLLVG